MWNCEKCGAEMPDQFDNCTNCRNPNLPPVNDVEPIYSWMAIAVGVLAPLSFFGVAVFLGNGWGGLLVAACLYGLGFWIALAAWFRGEKPIWLVVLGTLLNLLPPVMVLIH